VANAITKKTLTTTTRTLNVTRVNTLVLKDSNNIATLALLNNKRTTAATLMLDLTITTNNSVIRNHSLLVLTLRIKPEATRGNKVHMEVKALIITTINSDTEIKSNVILAIEKMIILNQLEVGHQLKICMTTKNSLLMELPLRTASI